ncbi:hypothetical protein [Parafrigoribacterium humi]|uniref:hypothetical protein n=1 Tax=Parafrigoribacterium humi TaxID=3144664 RepID=UPI0032EE8B82
MRKGISVAAAILLASTVAVFSVVPANAATPNATLSAAALPTATSITAADESVFIASLEASAIPRTTVATSVATEETFTYTSPEGKKLGITVVTPNSIPSAPGMVNPNFSVGWNGNGPYVLFNQFDQDAIISGATLLLGLYICAGAPEACPVVTVVLAAATLYLSYNGKCSHNRQLYVPLFPAEAGWLPYNIERLVRCV